jgi:transcriptional regulator with GAF, ATPase, and Fis domain
MLLSRIEVISGSHAGVAFEPERPIVTVGRSDDNDLSLPLADIAEHHLQFRIGVDEVVLETGLVGWHTAVLRKSKSLVPSDEPQRVLLEPDDVVELGVTPEGPTVRLALQFAPEETFEPQVVATRPIGRWEQPSSVNRMCEAMTVLSEAERTILSATGLEQVYTSVLDAALRLIPRATHATLILRDEPLGGLATGGTDSAYIPVMTRLRHSDGRLEAATAPVPIVRSIFRKVVHERSSILAADATRDGLGSESLLGSNIRSTVAVPLWKNEAVVGVLQLDNRTRPAMFDRADLDLASIMATAASLAISNTRLIERLSELEQQLRQENAFWRQRERHRGAAVELIGNSAAIHSLLTQIDRVANTRATVLIEGETGVGKELVAAAVHSRSARSARLFVAQNCATLPENLLESELFGHKKGSFTGAVEDKKGLFEVADGGTLFLDEVAEIPMFLQAKLLRALQEGEVRPVGSSRARHVDVRIIAASNRNLEHEVHGGRFREDLFYRLNVFPLRVPPLRERREDIPQLAKHFLQRYVRDFGKPVSGLTDAALALLTSYDWPGNVRELQNEVQRLVIQADPNAVIDDSLLSDKFRSRSDVVEPAVTVNGTLREMLEGVERKLVEQALRQHGNNKTNTAKALGITREGLHKKLRQLKL